MFRSIRPIYFLVYGREALKVFKELTHRVERDHPELVGLHYAVVFNESGPGEVTAEDSGADSFFDSEGRSRWIESIDTGDLEKARSASARARKWLCKPAHALTAREKGWQVTDEPIFILLVDNSDGGCPDWVELCQQIKSEWQHFENGLLQSFSILLSPRLKAGYDGVRTSDAFCNSAEAFLLLVRGGRHPGNTKVKEWLPQMVAVDGRLEDGGTVQPTELEMSGEESEESRDLRRNLLDLVYGMVGLTLTDQSTFDFSDREFCRTAGLVRIGLPIKGLLSEHRCEWFEQYSKGMLGEKRPGAEVQGQEEARKWLAESPLGRGEEVLGANLLGKITYTQPENKQGPFAGPEFIEKLRLEAKKFWDSRVERVPGRIEANQNKMLEGFEEQLVDKIGEWLDEGRSPEEVTNILKMIRGSRGEGLAGHTQGVDDLRSRKWDKVRSLEHLKPKIDPVRSTDYEQLLDKLDKLLAENIASGGEETVGGEDSESAKRAQTRREKLQKKRAAELNALLPAGEKDETIREKIKRVLGYLRSSKGESRAEKKARRQVNKLRKKAVRLSMSLNDKLKESPGGDEDGSLETELQNLENQIFKLESDAEALRKQWGFISLEGWVGTARKKTLPSGDERVVANSDDERDTRQELNRCRLDLENRRVDLENEPENPIVDGEIIRRQSLEEKIRVLEAKEKGLKAGWEVGRKSLEDWQADLESAAEQQAMVKRVRESLDDQLCISVGCAGRIVTQIKTLTGRLRAKRNERKSFNEKSLFRGSCFVVGVALVVFLLTRFKFLDKLYQVDGNKNWNILIFSALTAAVFWIWWFLKNQRFRRAIAKLKSMIQARETKLAHWSKESEFLFNTAADDRVTVDAMFAAIKAIDYSLEKVERVQDGFESFIKSVRESLQEEKSKVDLQSELPKTRALYSVMDREQLNSLFLTPKVRAEDARLLQRFKKSWSRSRLWGDFYETRDLKTWKSDLDKAADDAHGIIREFNLEDCLRNNPSILEIGGEELKYINDSSLPMAELTGIERSYEQKRPFAACSTGRGDFGVLGERLDQVWPDDTWTRVEPGDCSEASLLVLRPNIQARRIEFIQGGIQGLLEKPWREENEALKAFGSNLDAFFNISDYAELAAGNKGKSLVSVLPNLICSEAWDYDEETGVFRYGELSLGRSISEMLCRLAGVGLSGEETESLQGLLDKDSRARLKDSFAAKMDPVDRLFEGDLKNLERDLYKCWVEARDKALDKIQPSVQPPSPQPPSGESPAPETHGDPGLDSQSPETSADPEQTPQAPVTVEDSVDPELSPESAPEPEPLEVSEAESEHPDSEDAEPEPDTEADADPGDDPAPSDSPAEDSE